MPCLYQKERSSTVTSQTVRPLPSPPSRENIFTRLVTNGNQRAFLLMYTTRRSDLHEPANRRPPSAVQCCVQHASPPVRLNRLRKCTILRSVCPLIHRSTRAFCRSSKPLPPACLADQWPSPLDIPHCPPPEYQETKGALQCVWKRRNTLSRKPTWIIIAWMMRDNNRCLKLPRLPCIGSSPF
jgi:hypothetical protein